MLNTQSSVTDYSTHGERVHWIVARGGEDALTIRLDNMLALAQNAKACFLESTYGMKMWNPSEFTHVFNRLPLRLLARRCRESIL